MMTRTWQGYFWLASYLALILAPLLVLSLASGPAKNGFAWDMGIALGFSALVMLVLQFFITARLRKPAAPFGMDVIYYFHRCLGYGLLTIALAHPLMLVVAKPAIVTEFTLQSLTWAIVSGLLALSLMVLIVITAVWRKLFRLPYNIWRVLHLLMSLGVIVLAFLHMRTIDYYSATPMVYWLWSAIGLSALGIVVFVRVLRPLQLLRRPWQVAAVKQERGNCWTLTLKPDGHPGLDFMAGQFAWLNLEQSPFLMQEHPFSISNAPGQDGSIQFTIKELGDFTGSIGETRPGARAYIDGPYGIFSTERHTQAPGFVFISGGIGLAPIFGMLQAAAMRGDTRPHILFSAHSEWDRIPRRDDLVELEKQMPLTLIPVLEEAPSDNWEGETGYINRDMLQRHLPENYREFQYFMCGPGPMLNAVRSALLELEVPSHHIHSELFDMA